MSIAGLSQWVETPLGRYLLDKEQALYDGLVADVFGFNAVQLGLSAVDLLRANRIPFRACLDRQGPAQALADFSHLPVVGQSLDLLLLPHVLEFSANPHQVLREAERVLRPEGQVVISGFNPWSLWGVCRWLPARWRAYPGRVNFIALARLKDWLALLGFEVVAGQLCCYAPPLSEEKWLRRFAFMEQAGDRWWSLGGGVYILQARKRVPGMRLITPHWQEVRRAKAALASAAQKAINEK